MWLGEGGQLFIMRTYLIELIYIYLSLCCCLFYASDVTNRSEMWNEGSAFDRWEATEQAAD